MASACRKENTPVSDRQIRFLVYHLEAACRDADATGELQQMIECTLDDSKWLLSVGLTCPVVATPEDSSRMMGSCCYAWHPVQL